MTRIGFATSFDVERAIREGKQARVCDKLGEVVLNVNQMDVATYLEIRESDDYTRFEWWIIEDIEETEDKACEK